MAVSEEHLEGDESELDHQVEATWSPTLGREPLEALTKLLFGGPRKLPPDLLVWPTDENIANEALRRAAEESE